ncbi:MAG: threonine dehydratase, partial [Planctomycetota bacterium]
QVFQAQATMVALGEVVEPAGAATYAAALAGMSNPWIAKRTESNPLRVVVVVSGGNPDPEQLRRLQAASV